MRRGGADGAQPSTPLLFSNVRTCFGKIILIDQRPIACGDTETMFTEEIIAKACGGQLPILQQTGIV